MRKTKNLVIALKGLFLICALCLLTATQSNAQSATPNTYTNPTSKTIIWENTFDFSGWNFFQWFQKIVTVDMTRGQKPGRDKPNNIISEKKGTIINNGPFSIVTDDMSIRDGGN